jgi:hypothetical protein
MAEPDIDGIEIEDRQGGGHIVTAQIWPDGNRRHRIARACATLRNLRRDGWRCVWCGDPIPAYRRVDAMFCREGCRKAHARARRLGMG